LYPLPHLSPRRSQREGEDWERREGEVPPISSPSKRGRIKKGVSSIKELIKELSSLIRRKELSSLRGNWGRSPSPTYILPLPEGGGGFGEGSSFSKGRGRI